MQSVRVESRSGTGEPLDRRSVFPYGRRYSSHSGSGARLERRRIGFGPRTWGGCCMSARGDGAEVQSALTGYLSALQARAADV